MYLVSDYKWSRLICMMSTSSQKAMDIWIYLVVTHCSACSFGPYTAAEGIGALGVLLTVQFNFLWPLLTRLTWKGRLQMRDND